MQYFEILSKRVLVMMEGTAGISKGQVDFHASVYELV
jgi:hypothetical protein